MSVEDVGEMAVARVAQLQRQVGEIRFALPQPLQRHLHPQRVAIARQRLAGGAAKSTAQPPR